MANVTTPAWLLVDQSSGNTTTGYNGVADVKPTDIRQSAQSRHDMTNGSGATVTDALGLASGTGSSITWGTDAAYGGYVSVNGSSSQVNYGSGLFAGTGDYSMECFMYFPGASAAGLAAVISCYDGTNQNVLYFDGSSVLHAIWNAVAVNDGSATSVGWHHLVATWKASTGTGTLYRDGAQVGQTVSAGATRFDGTSAGALTYLGNRKTNSLPWTTNLPKFAFDGFYGSCLTSAQVTARYNRFIYPSLCALVDLSAAGYANLTSFSVCTSYADTLDQVLETSPDGATWTSVSLSPSPSSHGGTFSSSTFTATLTASPSPRYLMYSACDTTGSGQQLRVTDLRAN